MGQIDSKVFRSGNSEAVRLPKEIAYGADIDVTITRVGDRLIIDPKPKKSLADFIALLREIGPPEDGVQKRDPVEAPNRPGL
ncbi:antitoxin [Sphingobium boeckii]|uniref:Antitoxin VapB n=1 Tax=Sphingobium boeckii TaxID=1082345 RepID=A0A7W9AH56_9SPHN|nr:AbrB/MazE/SpoVT family DNA-binding domain-containing protein [Sphingobium boeckii]MBB5685600.1 antitoxin VapB [Sphingobium boeckii]